MNERNVKKELSDNEELSHPESIREGEGSIIESSINMIENPSNDDDSDEGDFLFHGVNSLNIIEVDDNKKKKIIHSLFPLFICLITKNNIKIQQLSYDTPLEQQALTSTKQLLDGKYLEMIKNNQYMRYDELFQICKTSNTPFEDICRLVSCVISSSSSPIDAELICYQCLILAYAYFELYCQCNYTGPELSPIELSQLGSDDDMGVVSKNVIRSLECDGVYPFRLCQLPHTLFIARTILLYIADPSRASWQQGIQLDNSGKILSKLSQNELDLKTVRASKFLDILKQWLSFRACVIHLRLLQSQNYTKVPTLWKECEDMTGIIDQRIEDFQEDTLHNFDYSANYVEKEKPCSEFVPSSQIRTLYLLEKGLSYHFFDFSDKV